MAFIFPSSRGTGDAASSISYNMFVTQKRCCLMNRLLFRIGRVLFNRLAIFWLTTWQRNDRPVRWTKIRKVCFRSVTTCPVKKKVKSIRRFSQLPSGALINTVQRTWKAQIILKAENQDKNGNFNIDKQIWMWNYVLIWCTALGRVTNDEKTGKNDFWFVEVFLVVVSISFCSLCMQKWKMLATGTLAFNKCYILLVPI